MPTFFLAVSLPLRFIAPVEFAARLAELRAQRAHRAR
jgi:hypothetical protein